MLREDKEMYTIFLSVQFFCNIKIFPNKVQYINRVMATHYGHPVALHVPSSCSSTQEHHSKASDVRSGRPNWLHSFSELPGTWINSGSGCELKSPGQAAEDLACLVLDPRTSRVAWASHAPSERWTLWPGIYLRSLLAWWFYVLHPPLHPSDKAMD